MQSTIWKISVSFNTPAPPTSQDSKLSLATTVGLKFSDWSAIFKLTISHQRLGVTRQNGHLHKYRDTCLHRHIICTCNLVLIIFDVVNASSCTLGTRSNNFRQSNSCFLSALHSSSLYCLLLSSFRTPSTPSIQLALTASITTVITHSPPTLWHLESRLWSDT